MLQDIIRENILRCSPGEKLPPELDMAKLYNVNRGTISKALTSLAQEGLITRKPKQGSIVVDRKQRKLPYRIGVLLDIARGHIYGMMHSLVLQQIQQNHYFPLNLDVYMDTDMTFQSYWREVLDTKPEFIVADGFKGFPFEILNENMSRIKNLIFINRVETSLRFPAVYILSDYETGGYLGAQHLIDLGHRELLIIPHHYDPSPNTCDAMRLRGIKKAMEERGLDYENATVLQYDSFEMLANKLKEKLSKTKKTVGIFAFADQLARVVEGVLKQIRLEAGTDYNIIGYFDTPYATDFEPSLTSVSINPAEIATQLGNVLKNEAFDEKVIMVEPTLIQRNSTNKIRS